MFTRTLSAAKTMMQPGAGTSFRAAELRTARKEKSSNYPCVQSALIIQWELKARSTPALACRA